ncbi:bacteriohemerythrin [Maridesulfovibrio sp. FT414]|uniref:bacteriohemerythrin n=1 Tax=Maridesulfovibrio sp. FT414 TaxID=2979469 RepID=UPI003D805D7D
MLMFYYQLIEFNQLTKRDRTMTGNNFPTQSLYTGVGIIDNQHQTFFAILHKIRKLSQENDCGSFGDILEELQLYSRFHFETEETIMETAGAENLQAHKMEHKKFIEKIEELVLQNILEDPCFPEELASFVEKWLVDHILNTDKLDLADISAE